MTYARLKTAAARIAEDYLRILRFFRFHAAYGQGAPDPDGLHAAIVAREGLHKLSRERVRVELLKLLLAPRAGAHRRATINEGSALENLKLSRPRKFGDAASKMAATKPAGMRRLAAKADAAAASPGFFACRPAS